MRKILFILFIIMANVVLTRPLLAQENPTETPAPTTTPSHEEAAEKDSIKQKINDLKERLATRVAELQEKNKRAFYGIVKEKSESNLIFSYKDMEMPVATDDETELFTISTSGKKTKTALDSLALGQSVTVFGSLDLDQKTIIAKYLFVQELPRIAYGRVTTIDTAEGTLNIKSKSGIVVLDYEINTRCTLFEAEKRKTCGLSRIEAGDRVFVRMRAVDGDLTRATALRILLVPDTTPTDTPTE